MEVYATAVRVSDTLVTLVGCVSHLIVVMLSWRHLRDDRKGSTFVIEVYSTAVLARLLFNWLIIHRTQTISNEHTIFFSYGLCIVVGQKFCCVVDSIASQLVPFTILLVPSFMSLRAAILFKNAPSKKNVKWILLVIYLTTFPLFVILLIILLESPVIEVPEDLLSEARVAPPYAELTQLWQIQMFFFGSNLSVICVPITFILRFIMIRKLNSLSSSMSSKTSELHWSFVGLITFDAVCLLLGVVVTILRYLSSAEYISSPVLATWLNAFSSPILCSMPTVQGLASLYYVPYIRKAILAYFGKIHSGRILDSSST